MKSQEVTLTTRDVKIAITPSLKYLLKVYRIPPTKNKTSVIHTEKVEGVNRTCERH